MVMHRNTGAPFRRDNGDPWMTGEDAEPTKHELAKFKYKLKPISPAERKPPSEKVEHIQPPPPDGEWPLVMSPQRYEELHPEGRYADLARKLMAPEQVPNKERDDDSDEDQ